MSLILGYDPETLREQVDLDACDARLAELGDQRSLQALLERVWLLKVPGRLDDALDVRRSEPAEDGEVLGHGGLPGGLDDGVEVGVSGAALDRVELALLTRR